VFKKLLVPVDIADPNPARPALATAAYLVDAEAEICLIYVIPFMVDAALEYLPKNFFDAEAAQAKEQLQAMALEAGLPQSRTRLAVPCGAIHHLVLEEATKFDADLIIIGSHKPSASSYFLGSSASAILRHATCSVLVRRNGAVSM
jgi:nucleotide-binding universal stress UspA family protein